MKHVNFNYIKVKNFLSIGDEEVHVTFRGGINIITGKNKDKLDRRNGVGKSTVADSIHFAIFGETIREIPKSNIINNITQKKTYVELSFTVIENNTETNYKIVRTLKPTKCFLYINDEDKTESTIPNTTARIREVVHATPDLFQNCVIMSLNTTLPFMAQKKVEKRKFIEGILKLEIFSQMLSIARNDHNETLKDFDSTSKELVHQENYKQIISKQIDDKKTENENRITRYNADIKKKQNKVIELTELIIEPDVSTIKSIKDKKDLLSGKVVDIDTAIQDYRAKRVEYKTDIKYLHETLGKIGTDEDKCPVCLHEITSEDLDHIDDEKTKITGEITTRKRDIENIDQQLDQLMTSKSEYNVEIDKCKEYLKTCLTAVESNKRIKSNIKDINEEIKELEEEIHHTEREDDVSDTDLRNNLEKYTAEVDALKKEVDKLSHDNKILEYVKFVLSEEGVKSYIVKKILNILNSRMQYYLSKMDANCVCKFNEFFEEEIKNEKGQECSYFNFSGAERKNIDLACLFTFMDIRRMQGDVSYNLVMFDELLDSSLDEKGVELVISILKERVETYNEGIYIISHRKESIKAGTGEVIFLAKENGITKREYNVEY